MILGDGFFLLVLHEFLKEPLLLSMKYWLFNDGMGYNKPYNKGQYNPLYNLSNQGPFLHCSNGTLCCWELRIVTCTNQSTCERAVSVSSPLILQSFWNILVQYRSGLDTSLRFSILVL